MELQSFLRFAISLSFAVGRLHNCGHPVSAAMMAVVRYSSRVHWPTEGDEHLASLLSQAAATGQIRESGR